MGAVRTKFYVRCFFCGRAPIAVNSLGTVARHNDPDSTKCAGSFHRVRRGERAFVEVPAPVPTRRQP